MADEVRSGLARSLWVAVFVGASLALVAGGYWYYRAETERIRTEKYQELAAIAALKSGQIQSWRQERIKDLRRSSGDGSSVRACRSSCEIETISRSRTSCSIGWEWNVK